MELKPITSYKSNEDFLELSHQIEHTIKLEPNCLTILSQFDSQTSQSENFFTERYSAQPYAMWNAPKTTFSDLPPGLNIETGGSSFTRGKTIEPEHEQQVEEDNNWTLLLENAITTRFGRKNDVNERNTSRFQRLFQTSADHTRLKLTSNSFMPVGTSLSKELHETEEIKKQVQEGTPCSMEVLQLIEQQVLEKKETDIISETPAENNENKDQILEETSLSKEPHQPTEYKILSKKEIEARRKMKEAELAKTLPQQPQKLNERKEEQMEEKNIKNKKHEDKFQRKGSSHLEKGLSKKELKSDPKEKDKTPKIQSISQGNGNVENKRKSFSIQGKTGGETPKKSNNFFI